MATEVTVSGANNVYLNDQHGKVELVLGYVTCRGDGTINITAREPESFTLEDVEAFCKRRRKEGPR